MKRTYIELWRVVAVICLGFMASISASADSSRQYEIELLIFENLVNSDNGEIWPIDYSGWLEEKEIYNVQKPQPDVTWLPETARRLTAERNALGRSSHYRPLAYLAWRQSVQDRQQALPLDIRVDAGRGDGFVDGTVKVAVERYLHLYLDLQLHPESAGTRRDGMEYNLPEIRLTEHRRMRSRELHYFDNPRFGVIALITPFEPETESQPQP